SHADENVPLKDRTATGLDHKTPGHTLRHTVSTKYVVCDPRVRTSSYKHCGAGIVVDFAAEECCGRTFSEVDACAGRSDDCDVDNRYVAAGHADADSERSCCIADNSEALQFRLRYTVCDHSSASVSIGGCGWKSYRRAARHTACNSNSVLKKHAF